MSNHHLYTVHYSILYVFIPGVAALFVPTAAVMLIKAVTVQVLLLLRQMESTNTQATASKVSLLMLGQQAVIDAYLCLLHLTSGMVVP